MILGGKPKMGKTLLSDNIAICKAIGGKVFDSIDIEKGVVLMLALEDTARRLKVNIKKMWKGKPSDLSDLHICLNIKKFGNGGEAELMELMEKHKPKLVIVDTLKKIRSDVKGGANKTLYDVDYDAIDAFRPFAEKFSCSFIIITHLRKMEAEDPFDCFSGSLGLTAAGDSLWVIQREKNTMILSGRGRDMEDFQKAIKLDPETLRWSIIGDASEVQGTSSQQTVYDAIKKEQRPVTPREISDITGIKNTFVRQILMKLCANNSLLKRERGLYIINKEDNQNNTNNTNNTNKSDNDEIVPVVRMPDTGTNNLSTYKNSKLDEFVPIVPIVPIVTQNVINGFYEVSL